MRLIIGLGNPGKKYEKTRHNAGFILLDFIQKKSKSKNWSLSKKFNAKISECSIHEQKILLAKPMTFMNNSGQAVVLIMEYYNISPSDILVIHDDKDIPLGTKKIQTDRGHAGHNGIKSIIDHIGTKDFTRIRIGIASKNGIEMKDAVKHVLGKFGMLERRYLKSVGEEIYSDISHWSNNKN